MRKTNRKLEWLLVALLIVGFVWGVLTVSDVSGNRTSPPVSWECPAGVTCHALLQPGSELYLLTADGHFVIEVNGADSIRLENVSTDFDRGD